MFKRLAISAISAIMLLTLAAGAASAGNGPPSLAFYADGVRWRTVVTPTDLSHTRAPDSSYEPIYVLGGDLINVAEAAPGQPGFRGGRWRVLPVTWHTKPVQLTSSAQVHWYEKEGLLSISDTAIRKFVCPVIRLN